MQKKQRVYKDYDDDDENDYLTPFIDPLGSGQIDFEDFDYDLNSPAQNKIDPAIQDKKQQLKKSDQSDPSSEKKQNRANFKKQQVSSIKSSEESSIEVKFKPNQIESVGSFNHTAKTNEIINNKKLSSKANTNTQLSKESVQPKSNSNQNSNQGFTFQRKQSSKQSNKQFEVQMIEQSYEDDEGEGSDVGGTFYKKANSNQHKKEQQIDKNISSNITQNPQSKVKDYEPSKDKQQIPMHKKMILQDSDNEESQSEEVEQQNIHKNGKQMKNLFQKEKQINNKKLKKQIESDDESSEEEIIEKTNLRKNQQESKPQRDDARRKSSGPLAFKQKDQEESHSSNEKTNKQVQNQWKKPPLNKKQEKKRYGGYDDSDDEDDVNQQDQDIKMIAGNQKSDIEKGQNKLPNLKANKELLNVSTKTQEILGKKSAKTDSNNNNRKSPEFNKIDFYSQEKNNNSKKPHKKMIADESKEEEDQNQLMSESSVEIFQHEELDGFSSNPLSQNTNSKKLAVKGFTKQKAAEPSQYDKEEDEDDQILDTNPENLLLDHKKKNRMSVKQEEFFNFQHDQDEEPQPDENFYMEEQGVAWAELNSLNEYFSGKKLKKMKKRRYNMKYVRARNLFFTSKWFMFFHLLQNVLFWMVVLVFPVISVIGCDGGHKWMSHVAMAFYLGLFFIFDSVFAFQYISNQSTKYDLNHYSKNKTNRSGKCCCYMMSVYFYCIFEMLMTIVGLFDIYCDMAFATLANKAQIYDLAIVSFLSLGLIAIPKLYALILQMMILFCQVREEDKKRKYASRILMINEYRMQAANIDYNSYEKSKTDLQYGLYKFLLEDIPQFVIKVIFLIEYDCGRKYTNGIVYCGLLMALFNTYFGLLYRFGVFCYQRKKLKSGYNRKIDIKVSNRDLSQYGFRHIRDNVHDNKKIQSIKLTGENYEFMLLDEKNILKYEKFMTSFTKPDRIEFFEINKVKFKSVRQEKQLFKAIDKSFKNLRYLTLRECGLCPNFILQFKIFLDGNDSLARISLIMNRMPEQECYELLETCLEHPNLEIIQLAERNSKQPNEGNGKKSKKGKEDMKDDKKQPMLDKPSAISVCRGIQFRLQQNEALKLLEIRYLSLTRQIIQAIFKGLSKNKKLQRLVLTNEALREATAADYQLLGESLKVNQSLLSLDLQENQELNDNVLFHQEIIDGLVNSQSNTLTRLFITTDSLEIKANYLELLDQRNDMTVFIDNKPLEDVDIQE